MTVPDQSLEVIPEVALDFMNQTHYEEVALVKSLQKSIQAHVSGEPNQASINEQLDEWLQHTQAHFARENELMSETGFPAYPVHAGEHENALSQMQSVIHQWHQNQQIELLQDYVFNLWPNWFMTHVTTMDTMTAQFAKMNGYQEA